MKNNMQILSLNVGYGMLIDDLLPYIRSLIASTSVFCFQEMDLPTRKKLDQLLLHEYDGYYATKSTPKSTFHLTTYVSKKLQVTHSERLFDEIEVGGFALGCTIENNDLQSLTITNVHGESQPGSKLDTPARIAQSLEIIKATSDNRGTQIVIGDFNLLPETRSVRLFTEHGYSNLIEEFEIPTTRNEMVWKRYPENKQLYADYGFVRSEAPIDYDFRVDDHIVSDHLPLILSVSAQAPVETSTLDHNLATEPAAL